MASMAGTATSGACRTSARYRTGITDLTGLLNRAGSVKANVECPMSNRRISKFCIRRWTFCSLLNVDRREHEEMTKRVIAALAVLLGTVAFPAFAQRGDQQPAPGMQ